MTQGEFGKAFGAYRRAGGTLSRKEYAEQIWPETKASKQTQEEVKADL